MHENLNFSPNTRPRPELRCITDKKILEKDDPDQSPCKIPRKNVKIQDFHLCEETDRNPFRHESLDLRNFYNNKSSGLSINSIPEQTYSRPAKHSLSRSNQKIPVFRSQSVLKQGLLDLKKGSFSEKQSMKEKIANIEKTNTVSIDWQHKIRSLSPFKMNIAKNPATAVLTQPKPRPRKPKAKIPISVPEEIIQPWKKYMRDLEVSLSKNDL